VTIFCNPSTGAGEMKLTWSPQPQTGHTVTASADGKAPVECDIEGKESMGNGATVQSGHASLVLSSGDDRRLPLASQSLTVRDLFPGETVKFPLADLSQNAHLELGKCF
jgi:hypothetical protein